MATQRDRVAHWVRRIESGFAVNVQGMFFVVLLWMIFGLVYDVGNLAYQSSVLRSAVFAAAQDGAKFVDPVSFRRDQRLTLQDRYAHRAEQVLREHLAGAPGLSYTIRSSRSARNQVYVHVEARITTPMPVLGSFGLAPVTLEAAATAEAISGTTAAYQ